MTQRKCGTCRYFEEGGIAASGWCRHPERQELQHMVLVRKTELACRDGWDHDLWEAKDGQDGENGTPPSARGGESRGSGSSLPSGERPGRREASGSLEGRPERLEGNVGTAVGLRDPESVTRREESGTVFETEWSPFDTPTLPFNRSRDREPVDEIRDETFSTRGLRLGAEWRTPAPGVDVSQPESDPEPVQPERSEARSGDRHDLNPLNRTGGTSSGRFGAARFELTENGQEDSDDLEHGSYEPEPVEQSGMTEPFDVMDTEPEMPEPVQEPNYDSYEPEEPNERFVDSGEPYTDAGDDDVRAELNVPLSLQQEQCCRTCRDFRPAEGGRRGWCNNPFAFEQRQQVDADDLACHGTYGNWWSPADDWWIERADISHHSTPTPLVDDLIREGQERADEKPRSTEKYKSS